jgi:exonuclease VII large subunit
VSEKLSLLNPHEVLKRGYSLVKNGTGHVVKQGKDLHSGEEVAIMFTDMTRKANIQ